MKWMILLLLVGLAACSTAPKSSRSTDASGIKHEILPFVGSFKVHRYQFENGLKLLILEDHSSPTIAYQTWFKVGSRNEQAGKTGLAHLFEHMMFRGTSHFKEGEFDRLLQAAGVQGENAFTSRDFTAYIQELPRDQLELIVKLESDRMVNLIVNQQSFLTERDVVQNERRFRNENNPDGMMDQELFSLAFQKHPYHWPVIGYQEDLQQMSDQDAVDFYKKHYSPDHSAIIVTGDVDPEKTAGLIEKYYSKLPPASAVAPETIAAEPSQERPRRKALDLNIQVEKLLIGYHIPNFTDQDIPSINILQNILTGGKSSRLYRALVETGIATNVDSDDLEDKDPSLFVIEVGLQKKKKATQAESIILKQLDLLASAPVAPQELERAKRKVEFSFMSSLESNFEKAYFLGKYETLASSFSDGLAQYEKMQSITPEQVQAVARKYFNPKNRTVIMGVPK